jgi:hypothetical protein
MRTIRGTLLVCLCGTLAACSSTTVNDEENRGEAGRGAAGGEPSGGSDHPGGDGGATSEQPLGGGTSSGSGGTTGGQPLEGGAGAGGNLGGSAGSPSCTEPVCSLGDHDCDGPNLYRCEPGTDDCPVWSLVTTCEGDLPRCNAAAGACECDVNAPSTCVDDATVRRCLSGAWAVEACGGGTSICNAAAGVCECDPDEPPRCADDATVETCADGLWVATPCPDETPACNGDTGSCECDPSTQSDTCADDEVTLVSCTAGSWIGTACPADTPVCNTDTDRCECSDAAADRCSNPTTLQQCVGGEWRSSTCGADLPYCNTATSRCECAPGTAPQCVDGTLRVCSAGQWNETPCTGSTPVCNATAARCECDSNQSSYCSGSSFMQCSGGVWAAEPCSEGTPACDDTAGCVACSEHSQCPDSACHLSEYSPNYGRCFATSAVQTVTTDQELQSALNGLTTGTVAVLRLSSRSYALTTPSIAMALPIPEGAEVAILGAGDTTLTCAEISNYGLHPLFDVFGTLYLSSVDLRSPSVTMPALAVMSSQSPPANLWLDDVTVADYYRAVESAGYTHLRRSVARSSDDVSVRANGGALYVENSVLGPDGDTVASHTALELSEGVAVDVRYSNLWGELYALTCTGTTESPYGTVRNSILLNEYSTNGSIDPSCDQIVFTGNAGTGSGVDPQASWFADVAGNDFHLSTTGANQLAKTAQWGAGDPLTDIDGEARPQGSTGYAGIDQR